MLGIQAAVAVNQKNGKGYPFLFAITLSFCSASSCGFCYHFFNPEATGQTKMIAKIVKGDQLAKISAIIFVLASSPAPFKMIAFRRESKTGLNV